MSGREMSGERGPPPSPCFGPHGAGSAGFWMRSGMKKSKSKILESKPRTACSLEAEHKADACQTNMLVARFRPDEARSYFLCDPGFGVLHCFCSDAGAGATKALAKKIDEQNAKIDALSQEILKLEQQVSQIRPGIMIGESTPSPANAAAPAMSPSHPAAAGNTHIVARGETLTSIAKMYKVTVDELQQANHIEDGRKLQAGQTITIPTSATPTTTPAG